MKSMKGLIGSTIFKIENHFDREIIFHLANGYECGWHHEQKFFEDVFIEKIIGDLSSIENSTITDIQIFKNHQIDKNELELNNNGTYEVVEIQTEATCVRLCIRVISNVFMEQ